MQWCCAFAIAFSCGFVALPLGAAEVLDQQNDVVSAMGDTAGQFSQELGQTFTVGVSGTLSRIEVKLARFGFTTDNVVLTVYGTAAGLPLDSSTGLATMSVSSAAVSTTAPTFVSFDVSAAAIPVTVSDVLAFGISSSAGGTYIMPVPFPEVGTYAGGSGVRRNQGPPKGLWQFQSARDYAFKTYVLTEIEPGLPGDYNLDGTVDAADYTVWRHHLGEPDETPLGGNGDGMNGVDEGDYVRWAASLGLTSGAGTGSREHALLAVPEPAAVALFATGLAWIILKRPALDRVHRRD